jgi:hypothetical protein
MTTDQGNCLINMRLADVLLASYDPNGQPTRVPALPPLTLRLQALPLQQPSSLPISHPTPVLSS